MTTHSGTVNINIRGVPPELRIRFKKASVEEQLPYGLFLDQLLDEHESRKRRRLAQMASPLHAPPPE